METLNTWTTRIWTSELIITADIPLVDEFKNKVIDTLVDIKSIYWDKKDGVIPTDKFDYIPKLYYSHAYPNEKGDYTCMLKGAAIDQISKLLSDLGSKSYIINFGGDIYIYQSKARVSIDNSNFEILLDGTYSVFTSGNTAKRGDHIKNNPEVNGEPLYQCTVVVKWDYSKIINNTLVDILATKVVAREDINVNSIYNHITNFGAMVKYLPINKDGKLEDGVYIASPFFNPKQIEIRDRMASKFAASFRPDLTDSSKRYDADPTGEGNIEAVVDANIDGIEFNDYLVYPMRTTDLGTLFEVGTALGLDKTIIKYNEESDEYYILPFTQGYADFISNYKCLFDCSKKSDVICMGYIAAQWGDDYPLYYQLKGCKDNIMLSVRYHHVELEGNKYIEYERDKSEKDQ